MINSLFMLGSSYNKDRKITVLFIAFWICYMVAQYNFSLGKLFLIINACVFLLVTIVINLIKNRKINTILSVLSILMWSIIIDVICFFMFPAMRINHSLISYIFQGILFNYKYVFTNILSILIINVIVYIKNYITNYLSKKENVYSGI